MDNINKHLQNPVQPLTAPERPASGGQRPEVMARLWTRMAGIYGHKWTSAYGETPDQGWELALRGITPNQIATGITKCIIGGEAWPPSAPEFRAMCESVQIGTGWEHARIAAAERQKPALVKLPPTREERDAIADRYNLKGLFA